MVASVFILLSCLTALVFVLGRWAGYSTRRPGEITPFCANCGYDLAGLSPDAICPECACTQRRRTRSRRVYSKTDAAAFRWRAFPIILVPFVPALVWYPMLRLEGFSHSASWTATTLQLEQTGSSVESFVSDIKMIVLMLIVGAYAYFRLGPVIGLYFANRLLAFAVVLLIAELAEVALLAHTDAASWSKATGMPFLLTPIALPVIMFHTGMRWGIPFFGWRAKAPIESATNPGPADR